MRVKENDVVELNDGRIGTVVSVDHHLGAYGVEWQDGDSAEWHWDYFQDKDLVRVVWNAGR